MGSQSRQIERLLTTGLWFAQPLDSVIKLEDPKINITVIAANICGTHSIRSEPFARLGWLCNGDQGGGKKPIKINRHFHDFTVSSRGWVWGYLNGGPWVWRLLRWRSRGQRTHPLNGEPWDGRPYEWGINTLHGIWFNHSRIVTKAIYGILHRHKPAR